MRTLLSHRCRKRDHHCYYCDAFAKEEERSSTPPITGGKQQHHRSPPLQRTHRKPHHYDAGNHATVGVAARRKWRHFHGGERTTPPRAIGTMTDLQRKLDQNLALS
ncbi:hypothetical protein DEO72_LG10g3942 [Vigna unguiculata]|uniref:Uncharacterized protein n=1 Tax=Vigna unguiculata TaxID=3917 RepID=A0A4D6NJ44_VIGUN|nr:hypothetical protein DEO72_LG10g3942 [Vigna unguiculata]